MTEEEQIEAIKKWWKRYSTPISIFFSILLLAMAGYKYWHWNHQKQVADASIAFEKMLGAYTDKNEKALQSYANALIAHHPHSVYSSVARFTLAKRYAELGKYKKAIAILEAVAKENSNSAFQSIATLRMVRLLMAQQLNTEALEKLNTVTNTTYAPIVNELKGDIYARMGQYQKALSAYSDAMDGSQNNGMSNAFLEMKKNELATMSHFENNATPAHQSA